MRLPVLTNRNRYNKQLINFGGLNKLQSFSEGEMTDCSGISHMSFPAITQRRKDEKLFECTRPVAVAFSNKECIAASDGLYYDRKKVAELSPGEKEIVFLGSKAIVFPDKIYYDAKTNKSGTLHAQCNLSGIEATFSETAITVPKEHYELNSVIENTVFSTGTLLVTYTDVSTENNKVELSGLSLQNAEDIQEGCIFFEKCEENQYRIAIRTQIDEEKGECIIANELKTLTNKTKDIFSQLRAGDMVEISGCKNVVNNKTLQIVSRSANKLTFASSSFTETVETTDLVIKRKIPDFSCVCTYENRLWGCEGNTIYASALGDPFNFFIYNQLSTDSYSVESNTAGDFTACSVYGNYCLFFKENSCYKLFGNKPSNFALTQSFGNGIKKSDKGSLVSADGRIIYKGNGGIFSFCGSLPQNISQKLGGISMENAVAGSDGKCYYITADTKEGREEFVYDEEKGLWSKSGIYDTLGYSFCNGQLYRLKEDGIYFVSEEIDHSAQWYSVLCPFDESYYKTKNYSRLHISAQLFENSYICVDVSCDGGQWKNVATVYGGKKRYVNIPCVLRNCHEVRVRLSGKGKSIIESIVREFSVN